MGKTEVSTRAKVKGCLKGEQATHKFRDANLVDQVRRHDARGPEYREGLCVKS